MIIGIRLVKKLFLKTNNSFAIINSDDKYKDYFILNNIKGRKIPTFILKIKITAQVRNTLSEFSLLLFYQMF